MLPRDAVFADLHIHSVYNGNLSRAGDVARLAEAARQKGLGLLGTGDLTNKRWRAVVYSETEERDGLQWLPGPRRPTGREVPGGGRMDDFPFVLSVEVCCSDKAHHLLLLPDRASAEDLFSEFAKVGKIEKMGRPFLHISSIDLLKLCLDVDKKIELIPAHVWTPHFGMFGEEVGYASLRDAFGGGLEKKIHAIETGLSSDPEMNRRMRFLDGKTIVSFSDAHAHTLLRLGREATAFKPTVRGFSDVIRQIRKNGILGTVEVFPEFGKYHLDGHRNCGVRLTPPESKRLNGICPKCGKPLTIGVEHRVEELAARRKGRAEKEVLYTLPLPEIISAVLGAGQGAKKTKALQLALIERFGSELNALLFAEEGELSKVDRSVAAPIVACRRGRRAEVEPGYDGIYGKISFG